MFRKFDEKENISGFQQLKTSVQKGIRNKIVEQFPYIENCINDVLPKKDPFRLMKWIEGGKLTADPAPRFDSPPVTSTLRSWWPATATTCSSGSGKDPGSPPCGCCTSIRTSFRGSRWTRAPSASC